jgi:glycosyltransferase involved in cell wall biosynthesis
MAAGLLRNRPFPEWFFYEPSLLARLRESLDVNSFDVVVAESLHMYPYLADSSRANLVLDCHNIDTRRLESMASAEGLRPRGLIARLQAAPVRGYEEAAVNSAAWCVAVSEEEARVLEEMHAKGVSVVANGVDTKAYRGRREVPDRPELLFVGALDYTANIDAVDFLVEAILPRLERADAFVTLVGRGSDSAIRRRLLRSSPIALDAVGEVPSTAPYLARARAFLAPIRFGAGTRLKILEAMAAGLPVITTSLGCEGLGLSHLHDAVIADDPAAFAKWIDRLLGDDDLCRTLGAAARKTVVDRFDWELSGDAFEAALAGVLERAAV